jgi:hypothetical protein
VKNLPYPYFLRVKDTLLRRDLFTKVEKKDNKCIFTNCNFVVAEIECTIEDVEKVLAAIPAEG